MCIFGALPNLQWHPFVFQSIQGWPRLRDSQSLYLLLASSICSAKRGPSVIRKWWLGFEPECGINALVQSELSSVCPRPDSGSAPFNLVSLSSQDDAFCPKNPFSSIWPSFPELFLFNYTWLTVEISPDRQTESTRSHTCSSPDLKVTTTTPRPSRVLISSSGLISEPSALLFFSPLAQKPIWVGALESSRSVTAAFVSASSSNASLFLGSLRF